MNAKLFFCHAALCTLFSGCIATLQADTGHILDRTVVDLNTVKANKGALWQESTRTLQAFTASPNILAQLIDAEAPLASVSIPLPDGSILQASFIRLETVGKSTIWIGNALDERADSVFLIPVSNALVGQFQYNGRYYELEPFKWSKQNQQRTLTLVREVTPPASNDQPPAIDRRALPDSSGSGSADFSESHQAMIPDDAELRLLSIYTGDARRSFQGRDIIEARINLAISQTNLALERAGVSHRVHLTTHIEVENEARFIDYMDNYESMKELLNATDIRSQRDFYQADVVSILISDFINFREGLSCGLAGHIMTPTETLKEIYDLSGFTSVSGCLPNYTFSHELGHLLGLAHPGSPQSAYRACGTGFISSSLKTIMASTSICNNEQAIELYPDHCNKVPWYSSATATTPSGESLGNAQSDSASVLTETMPVLASLYERLPHINEHPKNTQLIPGKTITLRTTASGMGQLSYQWFKNDEPLRGGNGSSYQIQNARPDDTGEYYVRVTNAHGYSDSETAYIGSPVLVKQPTFRAVKVGKPFRLSSFAKGKGQLSYQWYKDDQPINNANHRIYRGNSASREDEGLYYVTVSDSTGNSVSSRVVEVDVTRLSPEIWEPSGGSYTIDENSDLTLRVFFRNPDPAHKYQWYKDGIAIERFGNGRSFQITNATSEDAGSYTLQITEEFTSTTVTSDPFVVTVRE